MQPAHLAKDQFFEPYYFSWIKQSDLSCAWFKWIKVNYFQH